MQCYRNSKTTRSVKNNNKNGVICKKKIARAAHIFLRYYDVKLPSYTFHFVPVPLFFTAAHFHLGGRWHFSFSHRRYKIFMFFFQQIKRKIENWFPCLFFFFFLYLAFPRLCGNLNLVGRKTRLCCCCFFLLF